MTSSPTSLARASRAAPDRPESLIIVCASCSAAIVEMPTSSHLVWSATTISRRAALTISVAGASKAAVAAVEKAGGTVTITTPAEPAAPPTGKKAVAKAKAIAKSKAFADAAAAAAAAPPVPKEAAKPKKAKGEAKTEGGKKAAPGAGKQGDGKEAKATRPNFAEWEIVLEDVKGRVKLEAHGEDAAGNVEKRPHAVVVR